MTRIWGADRYATAAKIAEASTFTPGKYYIASGEVAWDALSAGPLAVDADAPILLTQAAALPAATAAFLKAEEAAGSITALPIVGGKGTVGTAVVNALSAIEGVTLSTATIESTRIAGANRYSTSAAVAAALSTANANTKYSQFYVASGTVYADALAGVQLAGDAAPIMLVGASVDTAVQAQLSLLSATTGTVRITALGGTGSVSDATLAIAAAAARNAAPVITLTTASPWYTEVGTQFNLLANVTASDAGDGTLTSKVVVAKVQRDNASGAEVAFSTAAAGVFYVTFEVKDSGGLADTENATVNVVEPATISLAPGIDNTWTAAQALTSSLLDGVTLTAQNATEGITGAALAAASGGTALLPGLTVDVKQTTGIGSGLPISLAAIVGGNVVLGAQANLGTITVTYKWVENGITVSVDRIITVNVL